MKKMLLAAAVAAVAFASAVPAHAEFIDVSGSGGSGSDAFSFSFTFGAVPVDATTWELTNISSATLTIGGTSENFAGIPLGWPYSDPDNLLIGTSSLLPDLAGFTIYSTIANGGFNVNLESGVVHARWAALDSLGTGDGYVVTDFVAKLADTDSPVPEPMTLALFAGALAGLAALRYRPKAA